MEAITILTFCFNFSYNYKANRLIVMLTDILLIFFLIFLNTILSLAEIALVSSRKSRLEEIASRGSRNAQRILDFSESPNRVLYTIQVLIPVITIFTGIAAGLLFHERAVRWLEEIYPSGSYHEIVAFLIITAPVIFFSLLLGEFIPKKIALYNPEKFSSILVRPMNIVAIICFPLTWFLNASTDMIIRLFRIKPTVENKVTEEEIKSLLKAATAVGEVEITERDIIEKVFFLGDRNVGSLMTHRMDLIFLNAKDGFEKIKKDISANMHTNYPVFEGTEENVIGILNAKKLLHAVLQNGTTTSIKSLLKEPLFVPENMNAFKLLEVLKNTRNHFAMVSDEYGNVQGAVSMNDLFKAMVGNLYIDSKARIIKRDDGSWLADGLFSFQEFLRYFEIKETPGIDPHSFYTLGGFLLHLFSYIPSENEKTNWYDFSFEIIDMDGKRIDKVIIRRKEQV